MLRVTVTRTGRIAELRVEGSLTRPASGELWKECRRQTAACRRLRLDLSGVTRVDEASVERLKRMVCNGAEIVRASLLLAALLDADP